MDTLPVKILIVDDDEVYRDILKDAIADENTDLSLAASGEEALGLLRETPYDILITDLNMPGIDGLTLLKEARRLWPNILTIIITGYGSLESAVEAIRHGAYDYIQKPFRIDEVAVATRNAIDKVRILRERTALLEELERAYRKLKDLEARIQQAGEGGGSALKESETEKNLERYLLLARQPVPMDLLQGTPEEMTHVLSELERLKELRRENVITEAEFHHLKKKILRQVAR